MSAFGIAPREQRYEEKQNLDLGTQPTLFSAAQARSRNVDSRTLGIPVSATNVESPTDQTAGEIMTVDEAAHFLRVGRSQLYDAIGRGDVPHRRIGRSIRLSRTELVRWFRRAELRE